jgi:hypothetical protein
MHRTGGWGPVAFAVVRLEASDDLAEGYYCSSEPEEKPPEEEWICLGAAMFYREGWITRLIAASPDFGKQRGGRFKTIGGHSQIAFLDEGRYLALLERTDNGYIWVPWDQGLKGRLACIPEQVVKTFAIELPASLPKNEDGESCVRF